jgi:hypothetical protein
MGVDKIFTYREISSQGGALLDETDPIGKADVQSPAPLTRVARTMTPSGDIDTILRAQL